MIVKKISVEKILKELGGGRELGDLYFRISLVFILICIWI